MKLLLIEDNLKMAGFIRQGLGELGDVVELASTGEEGERLAREGSFDVILLDVMLPGDDGIAVCRKLRSIGVKTPILMLTALSTTADKVRGLNSGADDYLTKPFEFDELVARTRALLRRGQPTEAAALHFDDLKMDLLKRQVARGGRRIKLTAKEFSLLEFFLRNPERVLTRASIGQHVWDMNFDSESNVIDVYVSMLRRKIEGPGERKLIQTLIGSGYMLSLESRSA